MSGSALRRVSLRNIAAHKVRLVLSVLAVVLGVMFVTGSFAFTATLQGAFDDIISTDTEGLSVQVTPEDKRSAGVPLSAVDTLRGVDGVERVEPKIGASVVLIGADGKPYRTGGAPTQGMAFTPADRAVGNGATLVEGRAPAADGEVALARGVAEKAGYSLDAPVKVYTTSRGVVDLRLVGYLDFATDVGGYVGVAFSPGQARALFTDGEHVPAIDVAGRAGVPDEQLRDDVARALPGTKVETGEQVREKASSQLASALEFVNYFFVAFGLVALLVGTFIIFNTFSMLVAQRLRELGLLRAIGASRGQITRSVLVEALVIGVVGSIVGVLAGFALAKGILAGLDAFGFGLPTEGLAITPTAVVVPLVLGLLVTLLSAVVPALRAGRIPPVVALRSIAGGGSDSIVTRSVMGAYCVVVGVALALVGTWNDETKPAAITVGIGAGLLVLGAFLVMPAMARPIAGGLGRILGAPFGAVGRLAATNAGRNSRRTAATAFALTLGLTLVAAFGTVAASTKASLGEVVGKGITADFLVGGVADQGPPTPLPYDVPQLVREAPGVDAVVGMSVGFGALGGEPAPITALDGPVARAVDPGLEEGTLDPGGDGLVVSRETARTKGWTLGSTVPLVTPTGEQRSLRVVGVYRESQLLMGPYYTGRAVYEAAVPEAMRATQQVFVASAAGVDRETLRTGLEEAVAQIPVAEVQTTQQFVDRSAGGIDRMLTIIYALLGLALVVAVLGIVNTLALSVIERRPEIGMLRAVGTQRSQVRRTINLESTQIAIFGAVVGAVMGVFLGWAFVTVLADKGLTVIRVPWGIIGGMLLASGVVGVLASLVPAHVAARVSPLEAISD